MNEEEIYKILNALKKKNEDSLKKWVCENYQVTERKTVDKILEILKSRGIETYEESIYSISENNESYFICIDDNRMVLKKRI